MPITATAAANRNIATCLVPLDTCGSMTRMINEDSKNHTWILRSPCKQ